MIKIRLRRFGRKKCPTYRVVIVDAKTRRDGKSIEEVGFYDPIKKEMQLNSERILLRLNQGAQPTNTVNYILKKANINI